MDAKNILTSKTDQVIRFLFKNFLSMLEEMKQEHDNNFTKLYDSIPSEYHSLIEMGDYFDEAKFEIYRKRVLDIGNDILRSHMDDMEIFEVYFTFKE